MPYALAFIFITVGIYLRVLFSFIYFVIDKRVDKRPGYCGNYYNDRDFHGHDHRSRNAYLLSDCCYPEKKIK